MLHDIWSIYWALAFVERVGIDLAQQMFVLLWDIQKWIRPLKMIRKQEGADVKQFQRSHSFDLVKDEMSSAGRGYKNCAKIIGLIKQMRVLDEI